MKRIIDVSLLRRLGLIRNLNYTKKVKINHVDFNIPLLKGMGIPNLFPFEEWMVNLMKALQLNDKDTFLDVGTNIGQTLLKFRSVYKQTNYIGFEPNPLCIYYCQELAKANRFENVKIVPVGLSDKEAILVLNSAEDDAALGSDSGASLIENFRPQQKIYKKQYVPVFKFDNIASQLEIKNIAFIKIDVEGAELDVLNGMENTLREYKPTILCEILPSYTNENIFRIERQLQLQHLLQKLDYKIYRLTEKHTKPIEINEFGIHSKIEWSDYLFVHASKVDLVKSFANYGV